MQFTILKDDLKKALDVVNLTVSKDASVITSCVLFDVQGGQLMLWTTDRKSFTRVPVALAEGTLRGEGSFTVEAQRLTQWVAGVMGEEVHVETGEDILMQCGKAKGYFRSLDPASFPDFRERIANSAPLFTMDVGAFKQSLAFVRPFIGQANGNNQNTTGFQVAEITGNLMVATDSFLLGMYQFGESRGLPGSGGDSGQVPFKATDDDARKIVQFLSKTCLDTVKVAVGDMYIIHADDDSVFGYVRPVFAFPRIPDFPVNLTEAERWSLEKKTFLNAVRALSATAKKDDIALTLEARGDGGDATLVLSMRDSSEKHLSTFDMPIKRIASCEALVAKVNYQFLLGALSQYTGDTVTLGVHMGDSANARKYIKVYEELAQGDRQVCLVAMRLDT